MAANQLSQDPAVRKAFEEILNATDDAANVKHAHLDGKEKTHVAEHSTELTSTLNILNAAITNKFSEMHQKNRVFSPATLFSQSAEQNPSSVEAGKSTTPGPSKR